MQYVGNNMNKHLKRVQNRTGMCTRCAWRALDNSGELVARPLFLTLKSWTFSYMFACTDSVRTESLLKD